MSKLQEMVSKCCQKFFPYKNGTKEELEQARRRLLLLEQLVEKRREEAHG